MFLNKTEQLSYVKENPINALKIDNLYKDIMEKMDVSVTYIDAEGGYSGVKKRIVYCGISRLQVQKLKEIAKNIDPRAFIAIENVYEVDGVRVKKRKI